MKQLTLILSFIFISQLATSNLSAMERTGHLGIGMSNQLQNGLSALSFKLQKSKSIAFGGLFALDTSDTGGYGAGLKFYKVVFEEELLNFYWSALGALTNKKTAAGIDQSGFQIDLTLGSEFSFAGLKSIGFSFEFGASLNKVEDLRIQTTGHHFISGGIHFYL